MAQTSACLAPVSDAWSFLLQELRLLSEMEGQRPGSSSQCRSFVHSVVVHNRWLYFVLAVGQSCAKVSKAGRIFVLWKLIVW